ncbi:MAG: hypothetical protein HUU01_07685 [Saprospiraceae bacterium]|nr:hypothetical protein [Saprospiraceae bacterium]
MFLYEPIIVGNFSAAVLTAAKRPSAYKPEPPFLFFVMANKAALFSPNLPFMLPDCGLPTKAGDALNHDVLNLESCFVMKIEPKTIGRVGLVPPALKKIQFLSKKPGKACYCSL